jgi:hypothetical protein
MTLGCITSISSNKVKVKIFKLLTLFLTKVMGAVLAVKVLKVKRF